MLHYGFHRTNYFLSPAPPSKGGNPCLYGRAHFVGERASYRAEMPSCISAVGLSSRYTVHEYISRAKGGGKRGVICGQGEGEGKKEWLYAVRVRAKGRRSGHMRSR